MVVRDLLANAKEKTLKDAIKHLAFLIRSMKGDALQVESLWRLKKIYQVFQDEDTKITNKVLQAIKGHLLQQDNSNFSELLRTRLSEEGITISDAAFISKNLGGIDLNAKYLNMRVQNHVFDNHFRVDPAVINQLRHTQGFLPEIQAVVPIENLPAFLGIKDF